MHIHFFLKRRTSRFNFRSYVLNLIKITRFFFFQRLVDPGPIYRHPCLTSTISSADLSAKHDRTVNRVGRFIGQTYNFWVNLSANRSQNVKIVCFFTLRLRTFLITIAKYQQQFTVIFDVDKKLSGSTLQVSNYLQIISFDSSSNNNAYVEAFNSRPKILRTPDIGSGRSTSRGSPSDGANPPLPKYSESLPTPRPSSGGRPTSEPCHSINTNFSLDTTFISLCKNVCWI